MYPGLSYDLCQVDDSRKTAIINSKLKRPNINITALQETWLSSNGREQDYTFFWQGKEPEEPMLHGVGFAVSNSLMSYVELSSQGMVRILSVCLSTSSDELMDKFYEE